MIHYPANWPAPKNIGAVTTTRLGGMCHPPYQSNNMALHVGDDPLQVHLNRKNVLAGLGIQYEPLWLEQSHSNRCIIAEDKIECEADAAISREIKFPLVIMTADCLPILICNKEGTEIGAIHAGWRGLLNGVIENTVRNLKDEIKNYMVWFGPGICHQCFEVGNEVRMDYLKNYPFVKKGFTEKNAKIYADLPGIAALILEELGFKEIYHSNQCTFELKRHFYSYRREGQTGRMATFIWFKQDAFYV